MFGLCRGQLVQVAVVSALALSVACAPDGGAVDGVPDGVVVAEGWQVDVVRDDLRRPTQVEVTDDGRVLAAGLDGDEDAGRGVVVDYGVDAATAQPEVLLEGLDKPTGLAVVGDDVFVQTPDALLRHPGGTGEPEVLVGDLPNNGRSQGTITRLPDGRLAFEASGTGSGPSPREGSGVLYAVAPDAAPGTPPDVVATGFKGAYAHAPSADGRLWVTEIGDGTYDGDPPPGELNLVDPTAIVPPDAGWPGCVGLRDVEENGAAGGCDGTLIPTALFDPGATPTSVVELLDGTVLVALWSEGRVVEVDPASGEVTTVVAEVDRPQHLALGTDGGVWLTVFGTSELWRLTPPAA